MQAPTLRGLFGLVVVCCAVAFTTGCASGPGSLPEPYPNPAFVISANPDLLWFDVVDVVDDYFPIEREDRIRLVGDIYTEGRIETVPEMSATWLEPWRHDTVTAYERTEATLQTVRRRAVVRLIPQDEGFLVDVAVYKELEDLAQPEHSTAGAATFRNDSSLRRFTEPVGGAPYTVGWISMGRDFALEQQMLDELLSRCGGASSVTPLPPVY
ncbi:MAG: hypothetical protein R3C10_24225 [Pirellulales bacterium]